MTSDEAGRLQEFWKTKGKKPCKHSRVVDYLHALDGGKTGQLVCRECGTIFPDPLQQPEFTQSELSRE